MAAKWLALGLALLAGSAQAQTLRSHLTGDGRGVELASDERVTARLEPDGRLRLLDVAPAAPGEALPPRPGPHRPDEGPALNSADGGTIVLVLSRTPGGSALKIDSGLSEAFDYRAVLHAGARSSQTSVCTVLPLLAGYENWDGLAIDTLTLSGFTPKATNEVVCDKR